MTDSDFPKEIERKPLRKKWFMSLRSEYYITSNTYPIKYVELGEDRERQWMEFGQGHAGRIVHIFSSRDKCLRSMERRQSMYEQAMSRRGKLIDAKQIANAYEQADDSLPRDPERAIALSPGRYSDKLTKRLLMNLPTGAQLVSSTISSRTKEPLMTAIVPPLSKREGFWLEVRNMALEGRNFRITVFESEE